MACFRPSVSARTFLRATRATQQRGARRSCCCGAEDPRRTPRVSRAVHQLSVRPIGAPNEAPRGSHVVLEGWARSAKLGAFACAVHQRRLAGPPKTGWASPRSWRRNRRRFGKKAVPVCARSAEGPRPCEPQGPVKPRATAVRGSHFLWLFHRNTPVPAQARSVRSYIHVHRSASNNQGPSLVVPTGYGETSCRRPRRQGAPGARRPESRQCRYLETQG